MAETQEWEDQLPAESPGEPKPLVSEFEEIMADMEAARDAEPPADSDGDVLMENKDY